MGTEMSKVIQTNKNKDNGYTFLKLLVDHKDFASGKTFMSYNNDFEQP